MRVLICGLPGSGKTHFAKLLTSEINSVWFNADVVREQFNDWNYDMLSRLRQTHRMRNLADIAYAEGRIAVCDFVAPTHALRAEFDPRRIIDVHAGSSRVGSSLGALPSPPPRDDADHSGPKGSLVGADAPNITK